MPRMVKFKNDEVLNFNLSLSTYYQLIILSIAYKLLYYHNYYIMKTKMIETSCMAE